MNLDSIPLFQMIRGKLDHISQRERLIAQNVANADTPGFVPTDLKPFTIEGMSARPAGAAGVAPAMTNAAHLQGRPTASAAATYAAQDSPDSETNLNGNRVVLEDEMMKMTQARMDYDAAVSFYQKSLEMLQTAAKVPGK